MNILAYIPRSRTIPECEQSILAFNTRVDFWHDWTFNDPNEHRFANITRKTELARVYAVEKGYDALLLLDDDMVFPRDTVERLCATGSDVAYGLTVWRHRPKVWSACIEIAEPNHVVMYTRETALRDDIWGKTIDVNGVGSYCTLVKRNVLEQVTFERRGIHNFDYYLACDLQRLGIKQVCDCGLIVGHVTEHGVAYPDINEAAGYRLEAQWLT